MSGSPVAVRTGVSLLGRWLQPRVRHHSALSAVSWRSDLRAAANTQQLRRQNICSRWTSLWNSLPVQLCNPDITYGLFRWQLKEHLYVKHEHGALWLLICGPLEKHLLTYLLTYLLRLTIALQAIGPSGCKCLHTPIGTPILGYPENFGVKQGTDCYGHPPPACQDPNFGWANLVFKET